MKLQTHEWTTRGVKCKAVRELKPFTPDGKCVHGHWCGYMRIPRDSKLNTRIANGWGWNVDVHGGITNTYQDFNEFWWVGFDCAHAGDALSPSAEYGHYWTLREVKNETNKLVEQLFKLTSVSV